jgi:hypothetical protein
LWTGEPEGAAVHGLLAGSQIESVIGPYKLERVRPEWPWRGVDDLELATLNWVNEHHPTPRWATFRQRGSSGTATVRSTPAATPAGRTRQSLNRGWFTRGWFGRNRPALTFYLARPQAWPRRTNS